MRTRKQHRLFLSMTKFLLSDFKTPLTYLLLAFKPSQKVPKSLYLIRTFSFKSLQDFHIGNTITQFILIIIYTLLLSHISVIFTWISSHIDIAGNDTFGKAAEQVLSKYIVTCTLVYSQFFFINRSKKRMYIIKKLNVNVLHTSHCKSTINSRNFASIKPLFSQRGNNNPILNRSLYTQSHTFYINFLPTKLPQILRNNLSILVNHLFSCLITVTLHQLLHIASKMKQALKNSYEHYFPQIY